jgi:hypothetical protein
MRFKLKFVIFTIENLSNFNFNLILISFLFTADFKGQKLSISCTIFILYNSDSQTMCRGTILCREDFENVPRGY